MGAYSTPKQFPFDRESLLPPNSLLRPDASQVPARPLYLDEISLTVGYLTADSREIPIGRRTKYLNDAPNYRQFLLDRKLGARAAVSVEFTHAAGVTTWRQGLNLASRDLRIFDTLILELYERVNRAPNQGFALTLDKTLGNVRVGGGYASIDVDYGNLNADRFQTGNRVFVTAACNISPELVASAFITRAIGNETSVPQRTLANFTLTYDGLKALKKTGVF
jgi:hypothetical protein